MDIRHADEIAKSKVGIEGWEPFSYEHVTGGILVEGGIPRVLTKGPNKGKKSWDKALSRAKTIITGPEYNAYCADYEDKTGKCVRCLGDGKTPIAWHYINGTTYQECARCGGTGERPTTLAS